MLSTETQRIASSHWNNGDASYNMPLIIISREKALERASIMNEVNTYRDEMFMRFLVGTEPMENYDKFVQQMKRMKVDRAMQISQDALNRYTAR
jgi:putative aldouronate transport system substrate-binding protein